MSATALMVIEKARSWKDYQEKKSLGTYAQMEQKHWNPGYNNHTIFWMWYRDWGFGWYDGQAWCAGFVSCMFVKAFGLDKAKNFWADLFISTVRILCRNTTLTNV